MVVHTFNPSTCEAEAGRSEFEASLVYRVSSKTARATEKPCLKKQEPNKNQSNLLQEWFSSPSQHQHSRRVYKMPVGTAATRELGV